MPGYYEVGRTITAAEVATLGTAPIILVPGRPYGVAIPVLAAIRVRVTTPLVGAPNLAIGYPGTIDAVLTIPAAVVSVTEDSIGWVGLVGGANWGSDAQLVGRHLVAHFVGGVDPTAGEVELDLIVSYLGVPTGVRTY